MKMPKKFLWSLLLVFAVLRVLAADEVTLEPRDARSQIRAELLKYTPPGSGIDDVLTFVKHRLKHKNDAAPHVENGPARGAATEGSDKKGVKHIAISLGDYLASPVLLTLAIPLPILMEVTVQWAFDDHGRLIEIFVERKTVSP